jgi:hypothetical protein
MDGRDLGIPSNDHTTGKFPPIDAQMPLKDSNLNTFAPDAINGCKKMSFCIENTLILSSSDRLTSAYYACKTANAKELSQR